MEIKICGITNLDDAINACTCGADALGFIFYEKSPRYVSPETAKHIIKRLPGDAVFVGVFVNHDMETVKDIYEFCGLDMIQFHGDESPEYCRQFMKHTLIKALSPRSEEDIVIIKDYSVKTIIIDSRNSGLYGGTGKKSNWQLAALVKDNCPLILSGGLNPDNIMDAIKTVAPQAVDVNSGVEVAPGKKDPQKVKLIIDMVHAIKTKRLSKIFVKAL
jgi:phosphoribosylanthranilate isomerase